MPKLKCYSPQIAPDLLPVLYRERVARKVPMTVLVDRLIRAALRYEGVLESEYAARVAEASSCPAEPKEQ